MKEIFIKDKCEELMNKDLFLRPIFNFILLTNARKLTTVAVE